MLADGQHGHLLDQAQSLHPDDLFRRLTSHDRRDVAVHGNRDAHLQISKSVAAGSEAGTVSAAYVKVNGNNIVTCKLQNNEHAFSSRCSIEKSIATITLVRVLCASV